MDILDYKGVFGDWETFAHDVDLDNTVIRVWNEGGDEANFYFIVGSMPLPTDVMLILTSAEGDEGSEESMKKYGISFASLTQLLQKGGFEIRPRDQLQEGEENDDDNQ